MEKKLYNDLIDINTSSREVWKAVKDALARGDNPYLRLSLTEARTFVRLQEGCCLTEGEYQLNADLECKARGVDEDSDT